MGKKKINIVYKEVGNLKRNKGISGIEVIKTYHGPNIVKTKFRVETGSYYNNQMNLLKNMVINHVLFKSFAL